MRWLLTLFGITMLNHFASAIDPAELTPAKLPAIAELPDPLHFFKGGKVQSAEEWQQKRRPELKELFQEVMYGRYPTLKASVTGKVVHEDKSAFGGKATLQEIELSLGVENAPPIYMLLVVPSKRSAPVGVFVGLNFSGNHSLTDDPKVRIPSGWMYPNRKGVKNNRATEEGRGSAKSVWPMEQIIAEGFAVATIYNGEIIPDDHRVRGGWADVLMPNLRSNAQDATATIMAWSWGISRAIDYLVKQPELDPKKVVAIGHSRLGKTAIVAAAFDDRIAIAMPHQAGCGGTGPSRSAAYPKAESVKRITTSFPHWFCGRFATFSDEVTKLPFDQNALVAVCAPRPVLFTNATEDEWANPTGQFEVLKAANGVYKLLGEEGLTTSKMPEVGTLLDSRLGYWTRTGKHEMNPSDWEIFTRYAKKWLK